MSDLIDRQAAIEIIQNMYPGMPRVPWMRKDWQKRYEPYIRTENAIRKLPSVQPEIIRCGKCTHKDKKIDYCHYLGITICECDYCSYAVRRTDGVDH